MVIEFWQRGVPVDHRRIDEKRRIRVMEVCYKHGSITCFRVDRFNTITLCNSDIISIEEE